MAQFVKLQMPWPVLSMTCGIILVSLGQGRRQTKKKQYTDAAIGVLYEAPLPFVDGQLSLRQQPNVQILHLRPFNH